MQGIFQYKYSGIDRILQIEYITDQKYPSP